MTLQQEPLIETCWRKYEQMLRRRDSWRNIFQMLCKYIWMRPVWFGDTGVSWRTPKIAVAGVYDDNVMDAARTSAAAFGGALWPNNDESFEFVPAWSITDSDGTNPSQTEEVRDYSQQVTRNIREAVGCAESRFLIAQGEYFEGLIVMGTSGIFGDENADDDEHPFSFQSITVETSVIDENARGEIDTVYLEFVYTPRQVVDKYGYDNCSKRVRELYDENRYDTFIKVVQGIEPRPGGKPGAVVTEKPFRSIHFEYEQKHELKESGMDERCTWVTRFRRINPELYGRGLGADALSTIRELNLLRKGSSMALDKQLDPPMGVYHDQVGGGGQVNLSAGARVPLYNTGRIPQGALPVVPLMQVPDSRVAVERLESLTMQLDSKFMIDKLLDFNNKTRMTKGEAEMRGDLRNQALGAIFARQLIELYHPLLTWAYDVMMRRKLLGLHPRKDAAQIYLMQEAGLTPLVIPQAVADMMDQGKKWYRIKFISPAARAMQADSLLGLEKLTNYLLALENAGLATVKDNFDGDTALREYQERCGGPGSVIHGMDVVLKNRQTTNSMQAQQQKLLQDETIAKTAKDKGKATLDFAKAGVNPMQDQTQPQGLPQGSGGGLGDYRG